jgi:hypothetical protein
MTAQQSTPVIDTGLPFHAAAVLDDLKAPGEPAKTMLKNDD